jgi:2'-5' RNA ligase
MNDPFLPEELRLFVACELPEDWTQALRSAERDLERAGLTGLRWARPEGIHLTLKFLGEVGRHMLGDIETAMADACAGSAPFDLRLGPLGSFGGRGRVRVLWAGIEGDVRSLQQIQRRLDDAVHDLGFARETRPFSPHLTLARVPEDAPSDLPARVTSALRTVKAPVAGPHRVVELSLMRSQLGRGGAAYSRLTASRLGEKASQS